MELNILQQPADGAEAGREARERLQALGIQLGGDIVRRCGPEYCNLAPVYKRCLDIRNHILYAFCY